MPETADDIVAALGLQPHPEGGWYRETWREPAGTAIYYLLKPGERSAWHRVDATETWHLYAGGPLRLALWPGRGGVATHVLGLDLAGGARPQLVVPAGVWQSAEPVAGWALVGCTVCPAFEPSRFELAPPGWEPGDAVGPRAPRPGLGQYSEPMAPDPDGAEELP